MNPTKLLPTALGILAGSILSGNPWTARSAPVELRVTNSAGTFLPCRFHWTLPDGEPLRPDGLPFFHDHFVMDGSTTLELPVGQHSWTVERGPEYESESGTFEITATPEAQLDPTRKLAITLNRIANLRADDWFSGDLHIHRPPEHIELLMRAEDLDFGPVITWWNDANHWRLHPIPDRTSHRFDGHRVANVMAGEDERGGGALLYFGLPRPVDITGADREYPSPLRFIDKAMEIDPDAWVDIEKPFWWDVPAWLADGRARSIGLANNHMCRSTMYASEAWGHPRDEKRLPEPRGNGFWTQEIYYHILESGLRIPPSAGSASGVLPNPVGYNRVYVHLPDGFTQQAWWEGLEEGRCFVTNGPLLRVRADGRDPGAVFTLTDEPRSIPIEIDLISRDHVPVVEVVRNGVVVQSLPTGPDRRQRFELDLEFDQPGWFLVRAITDHPDTFRFASTGPFHVEGVDGARRISRKSVEFFLEWMDERMKRLEALIDDPNRLSLILDTQRNAGGFWRSKLENAMEP